MQGGKHLVTGEGRLHGDLRRLEIAYLADHDDIRILPQERAQNVRKTKPNLRLDLNLIDSLQLVFYGIFDRQDLSLARVEPQQRRIKRRCFAAAGRPCDEKDPVGAIQKVEVALEDLLFEAQEGKVQRDASLVEHSQDEALAVHAGHGGHAQVDLLAPNDQSYPPILWQARFGNI